jgi:hypothetical protein
VKPANFPNQSIPDMGKSHIYSRVLRIESALLLKGLNYDLKMSMTHSRTNMTQTESMTALNENSINNSQSEYENQYLEDEDQDSLVTLLQV